MNCFSAAVNLPRVLDAEEVCKLAIIVAVVDDEIGDLAWLERAELRAAIQTVRGVDRGGSDRFRR